MAETSARVVADFFIRFAHEHGDQISNLKLQKLLYYAQAWFLAINGRPLFDDRLEAWVHGPVVPPVYGEFKKWSWQAIGINPELPPLAEPVKAHLEEVAAVYGSMSAFDLERLTHSEAPWIDARGAVPEDEASTAVISLESMERFYKARINGAGKN